MKIKEGSSLPLRNGNSIVVVEVFPHRSEFEGRRMETQNPNIEIRSIWDFDGKNLENIPGYDLKKSA